MRHIIAAFLLGVILFGFGLTTVTEARDGLSKAEVQRVFIGKWWRNPNGAFLFSKNGTYKYRHRGRTRGPWNYQLRSDGSIRGNTTDYRFYRKSNGDYEYHHSRSNRFYPAFVK